MDTCPRPHHTHWPCLCLMFTRTSCLLLAVFPYLAHADEYQTIASLDGYKELRGCAQSCFWNFYGWDTLAGAINCPAGRSGALDSCYCRPDLQPLAETYLSTCVSSSCAPSGGYTVDLSSALTLYVGYCEAEGYTATPATTKVAQPPPTATAEPSQSYATYPSQTENYSTSISSYVASESSPSKYLLSFHPLFIRMLGRPPRRSKKNGTN